MRTSYICLSFKVRSPHAWETWASTYRRRVTWSRSHLISSTLFNYIIHKEKEKKKTSSNHYSFRSYLFNLVCIKKMKLQIPSRYSCNNLVSDLCMCYNKCDNTNPFHHITTCPFLHINNLQKLKKKKEEENLGSLVYYNINCLNLVMFHS